MHVHSHTHTRLSFQEVKHVQIVGIVNVTPDSYHDGGKHNTLEAAVQRAGELLSEGADIIEIGGESTGPRSVEVSLEEEQSRVIPILKAIKEAHSDARLAVDTRRSAIAEEALRHGVTMINDVTAGRSDSQMFATVAQSSAQLVLMYAKDPSPRTTIADAAYDDVLQTISTFLRERKAAAMAAGVDADRIILDPGMGHYLSSDAQYSFEVLARLREVQNLDCPIFISASRKSFVAGKENLKTTDRLPGTIAASAIAVLHGASYIRTHDVLEVRRGCEIAEEIGSFMPPTT